MPERGGNPCGLEPGRPATDDEHPRPRGFHRVERPVGERSGIVDLVSRGRLDETRHDRVARVAHLTELVAPDADADLICPARRDLPAQRGIGDLCPGHLHDVTGPRGEGIFGHRRVDDRALQDHRRGELGVAQRATGSSRTAPG